MAPEKAQHASSAKGLTCGGYFFFPDVSLGSHGEFTTI